MARWLDVVPEIEMERILVNLSHSTLATVAAACQTLRRCVAHGRLWARLYERSFLMGNSESPLYRANHIDWRDRYACAHQITATQTAVVLREIPRLEASPRAGHVAVPIGNRLMLLGGASTNWRFRGDVDLIDLAALGGPRVELGATLPVAATAGTDAPPVGTSFLNCWLHTAVALRDGVYLFGGRGAGHDANNRLWHITPDNTVRAVGVASWHVLPGSSLHSNLNRDPSLSQPAWPCPRAGHSATASVSGESFICFGGLSASGVMGAPTRWLNDLWRYDAASESWTELRPAGVIPPAR